MDVEALDADKKKSKATVQIINKNGAWKVLAKTGRRRLNGRRAVQAGSKVSVGPQSPIS
ncbi:MAG: hypothetical protein H0T52_09430 [Lautropia sp.]|nr:hypothetical protein [Lautropia sp.]